MNKRANAETSMTHWPLTIALMTIVGTAAAAGWDDVVVSGAPAEPGYYVFVGHPIDTGIAFDGGADLDNFQNAAEHDADLAAVTADLRQQRTELDDTSPASTSTKTTRPWPRKVCD